MTGFSLEVVEGREAGRRIDVAGPVELGRDASVDLVLDDELVSRRHARVSPADGGALVEDLGSRNGTFVNGSPVYGPTRIRAGDQLVVGVSVLLLRSAAQVAAQPSAVRPVPAPLAVPPGRPDYVDPTPVREETGEEAHPLAPLLDVHTKKMARTAPLALFVLVGLVVILFLGTR